MRGEAPGAKGTRVSVEVLKELAGSALVALLATAASAAGCSLIAANGSVERGALGGLVGFVVVGGTGAVVVARRTLLRAEAAEVRATGRARETLGALLARARKEGDTATVEEGERKLRAAAVALRAEGARAGGLLKRVMSVATPRLRYTATAGVANLTRLEGDLAPEIDTLIHRAISRERHHLTANGSLGALALALLIAFAIRFLPV